jgi:hypothetical protein
VTPFFAIDSTHIKSKKKEAFFPSVNFMQALLSFDNHLRAKYPK